MERDDLIVNDQYSLDAHHSEEEGVKIRKKIVKVTLLLSLFTIIEVGFGVIFPKSGFDTSSTAWFLVKWGYIVLTVIKAAYIVMSFMHLGDERKNFRNFLIIPYVIFIIYLAFILFTEGAALNSAANMYSF